MSEEFSVIVKTDISLVHGTWNVQTQKQINPSTGI